MCVCVCVRERRGGIVMTMSENRQCVHHQSRYDKGRQAMKSVTTSKRIEIWSTRKKKKAGHR